MIRRFYGTILAGFGILALLVICVLAGAVLFALYGGTLIDDDGPPDDSSEGNTTVVIEDIRRLNELATVISTQQVIIEEQGEEGRFQSYLPDYLAGETILLIVVGDVRAGINLDELEEGDMRVTGDDRVIINLPESRILSTTLDENRTRIYARERGVFRLRGNDDIIQEARRDAVMAMNTASEENGLIEQAENNAEDSIRAYLLNLGYEEVEFE